jgi:hypothetical protein
MVDNGAAIRVVDLECASWIRVRNCELRLMREVGSEVRNCELARSGSPNIFGVWRPELKYPIAVFNLR